MKTSETENEMTKINKMMGSKGAALSITQAFILLISIGFLVILIGLVLGKYFETHTIVEGSEVEHHAILLGNLYMSSDKLSVTDGSSIQRGVFDKKKLDTELINRANFGDYSKILKSSDLFKEIGYPVSIIIVGVSDLESNNGWFLIGNGPGSSDPSKNIIIDTTFVKCLVGKVKIDWNTIFRRLYVVLPSLWDQADFDACLQKSTGASGIAQRTFPVSIKDGDDVHVGVMNVYILE
jgi:hypothetical protein